MGLSRTLSEINGDIGRNPQKKIFSHPVYLSGDADLHSGSKTRVVGLQGRERTLTISSVVWVQHINVQTVGQTDRQTAKTAIMHGIAH